MKHFENKQKNRITAVLFTVLIIGFSSLVSAQSTNIRVIHLTPDAPAVDVLVNESLRAVTDLEFPDSTGYLNIDAGTYTFDVVPAGAGIESSVLTIPDLPLSADTYYTAVAYNSLSMISPMALVDDYADLAHGNIRLRAIHTAVGVGEVDIWLIPESGDPSPLWVDVPFSGVGNYIDVASAAYILGFDVDNDANPDVIFDVPQLPSGTVANVFAVTDASGALFLNAQMNDGTTARINPRSCPFFGVDLAVPGDTIIKGDTFFVTATTCNPGAPESLPFFGILDLGTGEYWFFPSWKSSYEGIDYLDLTVESGAMEFALLDAFIWPDTGDLSIDAHFYGALLNPEMTAIMGISDVVTVHFGV